jgi:hypothetical protein
MLQKLDILYNENKIVKDLMNAFWIDTKLTNILGQSFLKTLKIYSWMQFQDFLSF